RILDANFNRAREALRVLEDLARFHHDDAALAAALKDARHAIDREARPHAKALLEARDSERDVGRDGDRPVRGSRSLSEIARANFKRAEEALRTLEEIAKGRLATIHAAAHRIRYALYAAEKRFVDPKA